MKKSFIKPFKDWQYEEVEQAFGLVRLRTLPLLDTLAALRLATNHPQRTTIENYRLEALDDIETWNEDEYKFMFISPFFKLVNFKSKHFKVFTQRPMSVLYDNNTREAVGKVEFMLAQGKQIPRKPHFFLHEYKPEKNRDNDPCSQVLIAMVAAQKVNADDKPIYGIYVNGRNWFLVVLDGNQYARSLAYDITADTIFNLFAVLEHLRDKMEDLYKNLI